MIKNSTLLNTIQKDFKRYRNNPSKLAKLLKVLRMLENGIELPAVFL